MYPENLKYSEEHEWLLENNGVATIGITSFAVESLGDIVFIEFPSLNSNYNKGESMGTIEAVKTVADIFMPISGQIIELNDVLNDNPETANNNPFNDGGILKLQIKDMCEVSDLMDSKKYKTFIS